MRRALLPDALIALALSAGVLLAAPGPAFGDTAEREALRRAVLSRHIDWAREPAARHKPDEIGPYDLTALEIQVTVTPGRTPGEARFLVEITPQSPLGGVVSLLAIDWRPRSVIAVGAGLELDFRDAPESAEVLISTLDLENQGRFTLDIEADLEVPCADAARCLVSESPNHLVQFGWYPADFHRPLDDRFRLTVEARAEDGGSACITGHGTRSMDALPTERTLAAGPTTLPGLVWGALEAVAHGGAPRLFTCTTDDDAEAPPRLVSVLRDVVNHHQERLGPYPFEHLTAAVIANASGAGLSPMEMLLLPRFVWTRNGPDGDALRDALLAHEVTHQYIFNSVGVTEPADAWLSEGLAEYMACRFLEARTGTDDAFRLNYWGYVLGVASETDAPLHSAAAPQSRDAFEILYQKGSAVFRRAERRSGAARLDNFLATFFEDRKGQIGTTEELLTLSVGWLGEASAALEADVASVGVSLIEAQTEHGRGLAEVSRLRLPIRPRRGQPELTPVWLYGSGEGPERIEVTLGVNEAPVEIPAQVKWIRVDPDLQTFRRVLPQPAQDVNLSGVVDGMDLLDVLAGQGRARPTPDWDETLDVEHDDRIDERDVAAVIAAFGTGW